MVTKKLKKKAQRITSDSTSDLPEASAEEKKGIKVKKLKLKELPVLKSQKELRAFTSEVTKSDAKDHPWTAFEGFDKNDKKIMVYHSKAAIMREKLKRQPTVRTFIPRNDGEARSVPQIVNPNGYKLNIPKGTYIDLPFQIAEIIRKSHQQVEDAYADINARFGLDRDAEKAEVLQV